MYGGTIRNEKFKSPDLFDLLLSLQPIYLRKQLSEMLQKWIIFC